MNHLTTSQGGDRIKSEALMQLQRLVATAQKFLNRKATIGALRTAVRRAEDFLKGTQPGDKQAQR